MTNPTPQHLAPRTRTRPLILAARILAGALVVLTGVAVGAAADDPLGTVPSGKDRGYICTVDETKASGLVVCDNPGGRY